jgi:hypothetical protein
VREELDQELVAAITKMRRYEEAFKEARGEVRELLVQAAEEGTSYYELAGLMEIDRSALYRKPWELPLRSELETA